MESPEQSKVWSDERVEHAVGRLLQTGVLLSAGIVLFGGILYLIQIGGSVADYRNFDASREALHGVWPVLAGAVRLNGRSVIQLGLLVLIATPVARVAFAIVAFWRQRDHVYTAVSSLVLVILLYSLLGLHW